MTEKVAEISELKDILQRGVTELGISLSDEATLSFCKYYDYLEKRGRELNLTAIFGQEHVAQLHFLDSLALLRSIDFVNKRVIDIGSGAGFPGVPIKIAESSIDLTLLDATAKRVAFLADLCRHLEIEAMCTHARAEEAGKEETMRENYDIVVSRAVAKLNVLCELCLPFVQVGGVFLAMKGKDTDAELDSALRSIATLGAEYEKTYEYMIPCTDISHSVVIIKKIAPTQGIYPRRFAKIIKNQL